MARAKKETLPAKAGSKAVGAAVSWKDRMAKMAETAVERDPLTGGGSWISIKNDGNFHFGDDVLGDTITVVVLDFSFDNAYYDAPFDPDDPASPVCFSVAMQEDEMVPHESSPEPQAESCAECPMNEFGTDIRGRGKACKNSRRLAVVAVDPEAGYEVNPDSEKAFIRLAPTSIRYWKSYVSKVFKVTGMPPMGVVTQLTLEALPQGSGYAVIPSLVQEIEDAASQEALGSLYDDMAEELISPYKIQTEEERAERAASKKKKRGPTRAPAAKPKAKPAAAAAGGSRAGGRRKF